MEYQYNYSDIDPSLFNAKDREQKAKKIIAVLSEYYNNDLSTLKLLDIGSSTGIITSFLSWHFFNTTGADIDIKAVEFAKEHFENEKLHFEIADSMQLPFPDNSYDVINCAQVYEHVPDSKILISEIFRILKPGGICFFSAANRFVLMEGHYNLPLLSVVPKKLAHLYLKILKRGDHYYETHLSYWALKKLTAKFERIDFTKKVINDPKKYNATEMITPGSFKQTLALFILKTSYWLFPNYIWLLKKPTNDKE